MTWGSDGPRKKLSVPNHAKFERSRSTCVSGDRCVKNVIQRALPLERYAQNLIVFSFGKTVCAHLAPAGILAFFWLHRENSKFLWTITKKSFYRSFNAIFEKIGRLASEEVIVHLISVKCLPVLMYGLDACPVCVSDKRSLDFIITRTFMKKISD